MAKSNHGRVGEALELLNRGLLPFVERELQAFHGDTRIFIYPGFRFETVDAIVTNFHLPESTLLMLVCAFGGYHQVMAAYRHAVAQGYRFFSYGDAMYIERQHKG